jgi:hypothetical protein
MKSTFIVHIALPDYFDQHFYSLISEQRSQLTKLMEQRIVLSYSLDMDRKNMWLYVEADNEKKVMDILSTFPVIKKVKISIQELAFLESAPQALPDLMLN